MAGEYDKRRRENPASKRLTADDSARAQAQSFRL